MIRSIKATDLKVGDVMALPMGKTATVRTVKVGTKFVNIVTEHGPARIIKYDEVLLEVPDPDYDPDWKQKAIAADIAFMAEVFMRPREDDEL